MKYKLLLRFFLAIVLVLGIFFRFTHLEDKVYWYDEAITSLRASGYTQEDVVQHFSEKSVVSVTELQRYQHPDGTRSVIDVAKSLAKEDPQHPPLYYGLLHFWLHSIGSSVALARLLPALLSLLAFPCAYWLCQELFVETGIFADKLPTWLTIGLIAVSPFHLLYSQESRQYSLWTVTTLLSTAALLRAIRLKTRISWVIYTLTLIINLYTFLLAGLVAIAHGLYVILIYGFRHRRIVKSYLVASLLGFIVFLPSAWILIINQSQAKKDLDWTFIFHLKNSELKDIWIQHLGRIFFDLNQEPWDFYVHRVLLVLIVYAFYCLCRQTPISVWLLIILLTCVSTLPLMVPDLIFGGMRSIASRYMIPSFLGVQLAIAYLLGRNLANPSLKFWHQKFWQLLLVILFSGSILSCAINAQATVWYNKGRNGENIAVAKIINQTTHPLLIISDTSVGDILSLSHSLNPNVQIIFKPSQTETFKVYLPTVGELKPFSDVFLYRYQTRKVRFKELAKQQNYKFEPIVFRFAKFSTDQPVLWRVIPILKKLERQT
ncbi:glycosyltransferase family 39 protein [Nostoc sp.]|uniref:glycosyltransferase family 39 protein n=1 Tax=Nostoc sp. TaxID=1180 RepID=UPI002FFC9610